MEYPENAVCETVTYPARRSPPPPQYFVPNDGTLCTAKFQPQESRQQESRHQASTEANPRLYFVENDGLPLDHLTVWSRGRPPFSTPDSQSFTSGIGWNHSLQLSTPIRYDNYHFPISTGQTKSVVFCHVHVIVSQVCFSMCTESKRRCDIFCIHRAGLTQGHHLRKDEGNHVQVVSTRGRSRGERQQRVNDVTLSIVKVFRLSPFPFLRPLSNVKSYCKSVVQLLVFFSCVRP